MCPCITSKSKYAICNRCHLGLMCPSVFERENYCFSLYELCPLFADIPVREECAEEMVDEIQAVQMKNRAQNFFKEGSECLTMN